MLFDLPIRTQPKGNFAEDPTTVSESTNTLLETILETHLRLQGWIIIASFENMEVHIKDQVTNCNTSRPRQEPVQDVHTVRQLTARHLFG